MVLVLIDTETGTRRTIDVPLKDPPQPGAPAVVLTHPHFAVRGKGDGDEKLSRRGSALGTS